MLHFAAKLEQRGSRHGALLSPAFSACALVLCALVSVALTGCERIAEHSTAAKTAASARTDVAKAADKTFWEAFHGGQYDRIAEALEVETRAYLADPRDALTAAHVGWLHMWRVGERARLSSTPATITDDALLARRYFEEAVSLDPKEARYKGFLAAATLAAGAINQNDRISVHGYLAMRDAIDAWPEFNLFTAGYALSGQPADSKRYAEALQWQWEDIDVCIGSKLDRARPDMRPFMHLETREGAKRACWNSWIAPHNFEGFFLNMGDMLVKAGDPTTAGALYADARLSSTYDQWPFKDVLEKRIQEAAANVAAFNGKGPDVARPRIMLESPFACMACHQQ